MDSPVQASAGFACNNVATLSTELEQKWVYDNLLKPKSINQVWLGIDSVDGGITFDYIYYDSASTLYRQQMYNTRLDTCTQYCPWAVNRPAMGGRPYGRWQNDVFILDTQPATSSFPYVCVAPPPRIALMLKNIVGTSGGILQFTLDTISNSYSSTQKLTRVSDNTTIELGSTNDMTAKIPPGAGTYILTVTHVAGTSTSIFQYEAPHISDIWPSFNKSDIVYLRGKNFGPDASKISVTFGDQTNVVRCLGVSLYTMMINTTTPYEYLSCQLERSIQYTSMFPVTIDVDGVSHLTNRCRFIDSLSTTTKYPPVFSVSDIPLNYTSAIALYNDGNRYLGVITTKSSFDIVRQVYSSAAMVVEGMYYNGTNMVYSEGPFSKQIVAPYTSSQVQGSQNTYYTLNLLDASLGVLSMSDTTYPYLLQNSTITPGTTFLDFFRINWNTTATPTTAGVLTIAIYGLALPLTSYQIEIINNTGEVTVIGLNFIGISLVTIGNVQCSPVQPVNSTTFICYFPASVTIGNEALPINVTCGGLSNVAYIFYYKQTVQCPGTPACSGNGLCNTNNGQCTCNTGYSLQNCSLKAEVNPTPPHADGNGTAVLPSGNSNNDQSYLVNIKFLRESDEQGRQIRLLNMSTIKWKTTPSINNMSYQFQGTFDNDNCSVNLQMDVYKDNATIKFAGESIFIPASSIKFTVEISDWKFANQLNMLEVIMATTSTAADQQCRPPMTTDSDGPPGSSSSASWLELKSGGTVLSARYARYLLVNDRITRSKVLLLDPTTNAMLYGALGTAGDANSTLLTSIHVPYFTKTCTIDPSFQLLLTDDDNNPGQQCGGKSSTQSNDRWKLPVIVVCTIVGASILAAVMAVLIRSRLKGRRLHDVISFKMKPKRKVYNE
ncbi:hypothetical protein SAMD00019534_102070 [Acytostelium subglobosum LB1]|uniref:hypothetical protein n=1 Tax=Acytostelium subglobosum LB1 TaxID=1410327 RepID=UPI0006450917|nr:hypothetical protein SAMD00019534_102070 [Acytostelium subglobosum LB1]GAM27032.1 hypothetical protein SAMD00019534_102070 [Acytostelium subglobosum LB1]|eukprot:XP_012749912.1 hypothetical protein SAMD00019534_102070 [Acytostelium subglobosum LB1]